MFQKSADVKPVLMLKGIDRRTLRYGDSKKRVPYMLAVTRLDVRHGLECLESESRQIR
jgi:hypothetical protein